MTSIYTIYKATNTINNKVYIGFDSSWPKRKVEHLCAAKRGDKSVFYNAIRKHTDSNFTWEVVYQSTDGYHTLTVMEQYFIKEYNSYIHSENSNGYNMTLGGEGILGHLHSQSTKDKIKQWNIDKIVKPETCEKISTSKRGKSMRHSGSFKQGHTPWSKGKTMSSEYSTKCSEGQQKRFQDPNELKKLSKARDKAKASLQAKAKVNVTFPDGTEQLLTPAEFATKYKFNLRTVYWNLKKHDGNKIVAGVLAGYKFSNQS